MNPSKAWNTKLEATSFFCRLKTHTSSVPWFGSIQSKILVTPSERLTENNCDYRTCANLSRGLFISNLLFEGQKRFFNEVFSQNSALMYGKYSKTVSNQERVLMARVRYMILCSAKLLLMQVCTTKMYDSTN